MVKHCMSTLTPAFALPEVPARHMARAVRPC